MDEVEDFCWQSQVGLLDDYYDYLFESGGYDMLQDMLLQYFELVGQSVELEL